LLFFVCFAEDLKNWRYLSRKGLDCHGQPEWENGLGDSQFHNARVYWRRRAEHCSFGFFDHAASQAAGTV
jgi:hypothetical protein